MVWQRRETDTLPSPGEVLALATRDQATVAEGRGGLRVRGPSPSVRLLFRDTRATPTLLEFLKDTKVGRMPGQILLAGGGVEDESDLKVIELGLQEEEEAGSSEENEEEDGPGPFSRMYFSFVSPCFCFFFVFFSFYITFL